jgi:serine/threonine protein kinase
MDTKNISPSRETQVATPFGTAPIPVAPSLKQTNYDGALLKDRYLIEGELGRGGIGVVYLARDTQLMNRRVVIKVLLEEAGNALHNPWFKKKFEQEIEALIRLDHPGIVGVLDVGTMPDGKEFFVMQFVEGSSLRKLVKGQMDFAQVARIVRQIGQALTSAHDKGIVHRDLKPENIMVSQSSDGDELIKLIDFGIASVKDSQVATNAEKTKVAGALPYMAPEQLRGQPDASSDIWALGAMTYEMLTGRLPFYAETLVQLYELQKHGVQAKPRALRADLPAAAEEVILKSLVFDPEQRYRRAKDLGEDLARALTGESRPITAAAATESISSSSPLAITSESPGYGTVATHSARTVVPEMGYRSVSDVSDHSLSKPQPKSSTGKYAIAGVIAVVVIATAIWLATRENKPDPPPVVVASRQLSISSRVQPKGKPPLDAPGDVIFNPGDQLRLTFNSPQEGFLYIVNESPQSKNGLPVYNFLFPEPERVSAGAPSLKAGRPLYIPSEQPPWMLIDDEKGTETLWLIWSDHSLSEFEAARKWLNEKDLGEIKDVVEIRTIQQFIDKYFLEAKPKVEQEEGQKTLKGGKDGLLVYQMKLAHT